jgi:hypothetical protein
MKNEDLKSILKVLVCFFITLIVIIIVTGYFGFGHGMMEGMMMMMGGFGMFIPLFVIVMINYYVIMKNNEN